ncbi:transglycosylase SLT domain-containing protein [uncultured Roseobacter sp.]|uniref:transglycosylase SLT domain-containing protein n=1 Tax=uncultured Roseobacter sp. TaxID=114847 RepID=UPI0026262ABE|nr:transglycosylase SLT domain-containing protein [uncultured Roseobacter sp.]
MPTNRTSAWFKKTILAVLTISLNTGEAVYARTSEICDHAAAVASQEYDIPLSILKAVTRTETGRSRSGALEPWPWALNVAGQGFWFETKDSAIVQAQSRIKNGLTNIDIGCFQLNYRWHGHAFASVREMFDPQENARYAARFLSELHVEKGDWIRAVGAYHSRTQEHAKRYRRRFSKIHADMSNNDINTSARASSEENQFPLLQHSNSQPSLGSLVPLSDATSRAALIRRTGEI